MRDRELLLADHDYMKDNWFYQKYYLKYAGGNYRYHSFHFVLNWLNQLYENPVIIETGCQRFMDDLGSGMSTAIFAEYVQRYGGSLTTIDNNPNHTKVAHDVVAQYDPSKCTVVLSDSLKWLGNYSGTCDMLYLDSYDYPLDAAGKVSDLVEMDRSQKHNLSEFKLMESILQKGTLLLLDDNQLDQGGKTKQTKAYLYNKPEWVVLMDFQQSLWMKVGD